MMAFSFSASTFEEFVFGCRHIAAWAGNPSDPGKAPIAALLFENIQKLGLTERTRLCLVAENIVLIGQLVEMTEVDLLKTPNLGKKAVNEIKSALAACALSLGTRTGYEQFQKHATRT